MDMRVKLLRAEKSDSELSRSFPTSAMNVNCLQRCIEGNGSSDSLSSIGCRSPRLGKYRKIPNTADCDVCHTTNKELTNLKCFHTFCSKCINSYAILKNGCPVCNNLCSSKGRKLFKKSPDKLFVDKGSRNSGSEKYSPEKEMGGSSTDTEFIFGDLDDEYNDNNATLEDTFYSLENHVLKEVETRYDSVLEELQTIEADAENEIIKIREHVEQVKIVLDRKAEAIIKNIKESKVRHASELYRQGKFFQSTLEKVKKLIKQCRNTLDKAKSHTDLAYQEAEQSAKDMIKLASQFADEKVHIRFNVKPVTDTSIETVSGKVGVRVFMASPLQLTLYRTFEFDGGVHSICPINSMQAWVGYQNFIQLCSKNGQQDPPVDIGEDIHSLALDHSGNVIIACQHSVKKLNVQHKLQTLFQCETTFNGIACASEGSIIACVGKNVNVYTMQGDLVRRIDDNCLGDIKMPFKVAINANGDVCISDYQSSAGEVAIFDNEGRLKAKLRTEGMAPRGLVCSQQGLIYVGDFRADRVNVYSAHGHFLQTVVTTGSDGLSGPLSVALDSSGDLWVGDWKRKVRIYNQRVTELLDESP